MGTQFSDAELNKLRRFYIPKTIPVEQPVVDQFSTFVIPHVAIREDYVKVASVSKTDPSGGEFAKMMTADAASTAETAYTLNETSFYPGTSAGDFSEKLQRAEQLGGVDRYVNQMNELRVRSVCEVMQNDYIQGSGGSVGIITGLSKMVDDAGSSQQVDAADGALTLAMMSELIGLIKLGDGMPDYIVMNRGQLQAYRDLFDKYLCPTVKVPFLPHEVPSYYGIPILRNDFIKDTEVTYNRTRIYAVVLGWEYGLSGFYLDPSTPEHAGTVAADGNNPLLAALQQNRSLRPYQAGEVSQRGAVQSGGVRPKLLDGLVKEEVHKKRLAMLQVGDTSDPNISWRASVTTGLALFSPGAIAAIINLQP